MSIQIADSYSESNQDDEIGIYNGYYDSVGQSFTATEGTLSSCKFYLSKTGSPTGSAYAKLYAHTGTFGINGVPTGSPLATSDAFDVSTLTGYYALKTFTFSGANQIELTNGTNYVIVVEYSGGDSSNYVLVGLDLSTLAHSGNGVYSISGSWYSDANTEAIFYVYEQVGILDKISGTDYTTISKISGITKSTISKRSGITI